MAAHLILHRFWIELLTREDIQMYIVRRLYEVRDDVTGHYQLDQGIATLVTLPEEHDLRRPIGNHIYILDQ